MAAGALAAGLQAGLPGKDHDQVLADLEKRLRQGALESLAVGEQQHQRGHAPSDAEHGQRRPQPVMAQRVERLAENVADHSYLSASTGDQQGGAAGRVNGRENADQHQRPKGQQGRRRRSPAARQTGSASGSRLTSRTDAPGQRQPDQAAEEVRAIDSRKNSNRIRPGVAPTACLTPISRVRSATETSMMFITPDPAQAPG